MDLSPVFLTLTVIWNVIVVMSGALYAYFGFVVKDQFVTMRYPVVGMVQLACIATWINLLLQRCALRMGYHPLIPLLADSRVHGIVVPIVKPLFGMCFMLKGLALTFELFAMKCLAHETVNGAQHTWREHLSLLEQVFFRAQAWLLGSESAMTARRYPLRASVWGMVFVVALSVAFAIPVGALWAGCLDPEVGFAACTQPPHFRLYYMPTLMVCTVTATIVPCLVFMLRTLDDPFLIREEFKFNFALLFSTYLLLMLEIYGALPSEWDPLDGFFPVLLGVPWSVVTMYIIPVILCIRNRYAAPAEEQKAGLRHDHQSFERLLKDNVLFEELKKTMAANFNLENGLFWEDLQRVSEFERCQHRSNTKQKAESSPPRPLLHLYELYICPGSTRELNLQSRTRDKVVRDFKSGELTLDSFDAVRDEVHQMMYQNSFPQLVREWNALIASSGKNIKDVKHVKGTIVGRLAAFNAASMPRRPEQAAAIG